MRGSRPSRRSLPSGVVVSTTDTQTLTNKTLTSPPINGGTFNAASTVSDNGTTAMDSVGFRGVPQNNKTAAYTLALIGSHHHQPVRSRLSRASL